jgi:hypothetical protein
MEPTGSTAFTVVAVELSYMKYVIFGAALLNLLNQGWNPQVALLPSVVAVELSYMKYVISGAALRNLLNQGWNPQVALLLL